MVCDPWYNVTWVTHHDVLWSTSLGLIQHKLMVNEASFLNVVECEEQARQSFVLEVSSSGSAYQFHLLQRPPILWDHFYFSKVWLLNAAVQLFGLKGIVKLYSLHPQDWLLRKTSWREHSKQTPGINAVADTVKTMRSIPMTWKPPGSRDHSLSIA